MVHCYRIPYFASTAADAAVVVVDVPLVGPWPTRCWQFFQPSASPVNCDFSCTSLCLCVLCTSFRTCEPVISRCRLQKQMEGTGQFWPTDVTARFRLFICGSVDPAAHLLVSLTDTVSTFNQWSTRALVTLLSVLFLVTFFLFVRATQAGVCVLNVLFAEPWHQTWQSQEA